MQAYMKSEMPFLGIPAPVRRRACNEVFAANRLSARGEWIQAIETLWREAKYREERYESIDLAGYTYYKVFQEPDLLPLYEEMIVTGGWWDYVDEIAARRVGHLLDRFPNVIRDEMLAWSTSDDIWKRRTSILCQLKAKTGTDLELLYACIEPSMGEKEFFLRKAIGWALRELAKTDPEEVRRYVAKNEERLSGLSKREALKNIAAP